MLATSINVSMLAATATDIGSKSRHVNSEVNRIEKEKKTVSTRFQWGMISAGIDMISFLKLIFTPFMAFGWACFSHCWCLNLWSKNSWFHATNRVYCDGPSSWSGPDVLLKVQCGSLQSKALRVGDGDGKFHFELLSTLIWRQTDLIEASVRNWQPGKTQQW